MITLISSLNQNLFFYIHNLSGQNVLIDNFMTFCAVYLIFIAFGLTLLTTFKENINYKKAFVLMMFSFIIGFIIIKVIGFFYFEPRPFMTYPITPLISYSPDDSFPSDHTSILAIMSFAYLFYRTRLGVSLIIATLLAGFARIYVGVHYPLDIVGGLAVGLVAVIISWRIKQLLLATSTELTHKQHFAD